MTEQTIDNPITDDGHWADSLITDDTPEAHATALKGFETQEDLNNAFLGSLDKNWREDFARGEDGEVDTKFLSSLERYENPRALGSAFREQRSTISSGQYKQAPGPDASEDDVKHFREANGIPLESDGYLENLPDGLVLGEDDKEIFSNFAGAMHEMNVEPAVMHKVIEWYNGFAEQEQDALAAMDNEHHQATEDQLRQDWGSDYRANINLVGALIETTFGEEIAPSILNARDQEGRAIMNIPGVLEGLATISRQLNPVAAIAPQTGRTAAETMEEEIEGIEKFMRTNRAEYNKDQKMQDRLKELYQIRIDHAERKSA
jgi:hypothetical protein